MEPLYVSFSVLKSKMKKISCWPLNQCDAKRVATNLTNKTNNRYLYTTVGSPPLSSHYLKSIPLTAPTHTFRPASTTSEEDRITNQDVLMFIKQSVASSRAGDRIGIIYLNPDMQSSIISHCGIVKPT